MYLIINYFNSYSIEYYSKNKTRNIEKKTNGLVELLLKKFSNLNKVSKSNIKFCKQIHLYSNAFYHDFDRNLKRLNLDLSNKWKFNIKLSKKSLKKF